MTPNFHLRLAKAADIPALRRLIERSVRGLQAGDYTPRQIEGALGNALGLDTQLIADGTYFVALRAAGAKAETLAGCGGWSFRDTLFGSDGLGHHGGPHRLGARLDPAIDTAKIRAIFVDPEFARQGLGSLILERCERAAAEAGFRRLEMGSTVTGRRLYMLRGYREEARIEVPLPNGEVLPVIRMSRTL